MVVIHTHHNTGYYSWSRSKTTSPHIFFVFALGFSYLCSSHNILFCSHFFLHFATPYIYIYYSIFSSFIFIASFNMRVITFFHIYLTYFCSINFITLPIKQHHLFFYTFYSHTHPSYSSSPHLSFLYTIFFSANVFHCLKLVFISNTNCFFPLFFQFQIPHRIFLNYIDFFFQSACSLRCFHFQFHKMLKSRNLFYFFYYYHISQINFFFVFHPLKPTLESQSSR